MNLSQSLLLRPSPAGGQHGLLHLVDSCRAAAHLPTLRAVHARLLLLQHLPSSAVARVKLIQAYAACSALPAARAVLTSSPDRTTVFFNVLLRALTAASLHREALLLFASMRPQGPSCSPDHYTYPLALKSCAASGSLRLGVQIHASIARLGLDANLFVAHSAISMYARCGRPDDAYQVFDEMQHRDVVSWNAMISGFAHAGLFQRAVIIFRELVGLQCPQPDAGTMASILPAMGNAKAEDIAFVREVFDKMQFRGLISWNAMLSIYAINGLHVKAVELFMRMEKDAVEPDGMTLSTVLPCCGQVSAFSLGKRIHEIIKRKGMCPNMLLENALMDMYANCGCLNDAREVFDAMGSRDVVSWTSIISAYGVRGHGTEAINLFENMLGQGLQPDSIAFVAVLAACSHAGLLDVGKHYFDCMTSRYQITPKAEHYTCMVDLLGRAGCIREAYDFIMAMRMKPNERVWGALLGACRIHSNMDIGLLAADSLFRMVPDQTGYYVLLSNIYARTGRWADVTSVRSVMASKGIKKLPGASNVEIGDQVHTFHVGDRSHPQSEMIYKKLEELLGRIRGMGYNPGVEGTLHDVEEEEKEGHLSVHSEKLAIAFVLINTSPGTPIRITMNLRTCSDCHHAAKLISAITDREIILKDINRFHHIYPCATLHYQSKRKIRRLIQG
uniref:DYW domain-containing protein n=1 Tax=Aegilops tauschii subsp. strangulata TaxID=200361 RepID=A0A453IIY3_AEGTS